MARLPKEIEVFMEKYGVLASEVWPVPGGKDFAVKHRALERIAVEVGIKFDPPTMIEVNTEKKIAAMIVSASLGDHHEWSVGEAAPGNCKNAYTLSMAEKRGKDRVILKLLKVHGDLYGSEEINGSSRQNPHVTTPDDVSDAVVEYDEQGEPVDNIPSGDPSIERLPKAKARADFDAAQKEMHDAKTVKQLVDWAARNANRIESYPADWAEILRKKYAEHRDHLRTEKADAA